MAVVSILWEDEREREAVERARMDWLLYGELHITNAHGLTVLDPKGITYTPTGNEKTPASTPRGSGE